ncbi:2OG-Fe(II) oxygenase family protein [Catenovulum sediminis]|uniref:2OG-Fe(II) oxygenase n=1 Tax=Catenovulum sediminis TaxID=1740262 RepID=A0ABV1RFP7_9ALTE
MQLNKLLQQAQQDIQNGHIERAINQLNVFIESDSSKFEVWKLLGYAYHQAQLEPEAAKALQQALKLKPNDYDSAMAYAQSRYLAGFDAQDAFLQVIKIAPTDLNALRGYASALVADQQVDKADAILSAVLRDCPDWLDGHKLLTTQRYTSGKTQTVTHSYQQACRAQPQNLHLWLAWYQATAQIKDWSRALQIIQQAEKYFANNIELKVARTFIASESGDDKLAENLFIQTANINHVVRDMAYLRFCLKKGDISKAEKVALTYVNTESAAVFWPYLTLIWRLQDNTKAQWLDNPALIKSYDIDLTAKQMAELGATLRHLHTASAPFAEQSVRGGTQTNQNLFLRHEPIIRQLKHSIERQICRYNQELPLLDADHPLNTANREQIKNGMIQFSGSWSVRLQAQGFNVSHTHPLGWISSALYIDLPKKTEMGTPPAGWLKFGTPPPELNIELDPVNTIEPKIGRLVLFPSYSWHSTVPFNEGERLVVAFDVARTNKRIN